MIVSFPFDAKITGHDGQGNPIYDRGITAEQLRMFNRQLYSDGVFMSENANCFKVMPNQEMTVKVKAGSGHANGVIFYCESETILSIEQPQAGTMRQDLIIAKIDCNESGREVKIEVKKGSAVSNNPQPPNLIQETNIFEIALAKISITATTTAITDVMIEDVRPYKNYCGIATARPQQIDVDGIFSQYQSALDDFLEIVGQALDGTLATELSSRIAALEGRPSGNTNTIMLKNLTFIKVSDNATFEGETCTKYAAHDGRIKTTHYADVVLNHKDAEELSPIGAGTTSGAISIYVRDGSKSSITVPTVVLMEVIV